MKRISNIRDLEYEKLKLRVRQLELEKQLSKSWKELSRKLSFDDGMQKKRHVENNTHFKTANPILSGALNYGASFLSHKLGMLAGRKIEGLAEQVLERLSDKISTSISKKKRT